MGWLLFDRRDHLRYRKFRRCRLDGIPYGRHGRGGDRVAHVRVVLGEPVLDHVGLDGEVHARDGQPVLGLARHGGVDSDHGPLVVEQGPAGVAAVDAGVGLEHVLALHAAEIGDDRADHSLGQGPEPALLRVSDGHHRVSGFHLGGVAERDDLVARRDFFELEQGEVDLPVPPHHSGFYGVGQVDLGISGDPGGLEVDVDDLVRLPRGFPDDHVGVGQDVPLLVDDAAGAHLPGPLRAHAQEQDHARPRALVYLTRGDVSFHDHRG